VTSNSATDQNTRSTMSRRSAMAALGAAVAAGTLAVPATAEAAGLTGASKAAATSFLTPAQVVLAWNLAYVRHDVATCLKYMSDDFQRIGDSTLWQPLSKQQVAYVWTQFFAAFPNWTWQMNSMSTNGNLVICEFTETGTWTKPFTPQPGTTLQPDYLPFTDHDSDFFTVKNGLITQIRSYVTNNFERTYKLGTVC